MSLYTINLTSELDEIAYIIARHGYRENYPGIFESFGEYITPDDDVL